MPEIIEGEWNNFVFKMITKEDHEKISANMRKVFYLDEPVCKTIGITEEMATDFDSFVNYILNKNDNLSFCALNKQTEEIAGIRITCKATKDEPKDLPIAGKSQKLSSLFAAVTKFGQEVNLFDIYGIDNYAELHCTSVNPEYRGQGLASEIYKRSFDLFRSRGITLCKSSFTSPITQKLGIKFGFKEHNVKNILEFKDDNGCVIIPNATPDLKMVLMALKL